jgi:hypothetical protein
MKILDFLLFLWVIFALLDPDPKPCYGGLETEQEYGCRTGPPGSIGWQNQILGIDSWAP